MEFFNFFWYRKSRFHFIFARVVVVVATIALTPIVLAVSSFGYYPVFGQERDQSAGFSIRGHALIQAYHNDGTLYRVWEGNNSLTAEALNAIVSCATGVSTTPFGYGKCDSWMTAIEIAQTMQESNGTNLFNAKSNGTNLFNATASASNSLIPQGCNANSPTMPLCNGWQSQASFDDEITQQGNIDSVIGLDGATGFSFDSLAVDPAIQIRPGDTLNVTITFSVLP